MTSIDFEPANVLFGLSWIQSSQQSGFQPTIHRPWRRRICKPPRPPRERTVRSSPPFPYDAGANSNTAAITFLSYGWQADTSTIYEAQVATAAPSDAATAAANLASQGYIITAIGLADSAG